MLLTGEIQITYAAYRKLTLISFGIKPNLGRAVPLLFLVIGVGQALFVEEPSTPFLKMGLVFIFIPAIVELLVLASWGVRRTAYAQPFKYEFTDKGMTQLTASGRVDVRWTEVARVDRWPSTWIVKRDRGASLSVPRKALVPADRRTLNDFFLAYPGTFG
jgi:hypothetical protein